MIDEISFNFSVAVETGQQIETLKPDLALIALAADSDAAWLPCIFVTCPRLGVAETVRHSGGQRGRDLESIFIQTARSLRKELKIETEVAQSYARAAIRQLTDELRLLEGRLASTTCEASGALQDHDSSSLDSSSISPSHSPSNGRS